MVLNRFEDWAGNHGTKDKFKYAINSTQYQRSLIAFPVAGLAVLRIRYSLVSFPPFCSSTLTHNILENSSHSLLPSLDIKPIYTTHSRTTCQEDLAIFGSTPKTSEE